MARLTLFCDIIVPLGVPNKYTYRVPEQMNEHIRTGQRVLVQFGKTRIYTGIVHTIHEKAPQGYEAKYIEEILDLLPVVTEHQLKFWDWIAFYYCANPGDVMNSALPSGLKLSSSSHVQLNKDFNFEECDAGLFTEKEHLVLDALHIHPMLSFTDIASVLKVKSPQRIIHSLQQKQAIEIHEDVKEKYKPKLSSYFRLNEIYRNEEEMGQLLNKLEKKAFKQAEALLYFLHLQKNHGENGWIAKKELLKRSENSALTALVKKNILTEEQFETGRLKVEKADSYIKQLSKEQSRVVAEVKQAFEKKLPVLLHGVTGSGKTEVYIQLIKEALEKDQQVLFLIPEIALTTQLITRLRAIFGELVGVYHSRFSENERVEIWHNILGHPSSSGDVVKRPRYRIILGARSSLFLPYQNLGLIIVDEEHDNSFKQFDPAPRYNARDAALFLAVLHKANIILGSATPSVESYYNCETGKYQLVSLPQQYVKGGGTELIVSDTIYYEKSNQMRASLTPPLFDAITESLSKKEQVILFQNRRGFAPYTECRHCGHVPHCIQCAVSLIYHKNQQKIVCHYCGYSINPPSTCIACGSNKLFYKGMGTEKVEEDIGILFPQAKVGRMDLDTTRSKYAYKQIIDDFEEGNIDILIGTQMVTKGLDFRNVSLVGVLNADTILNFPDFRSFEKAYQLLTQVRGRAGRNDKPGKFIVQTSQKDHPVIKLVEKNDYTTFYRECLAERLPYNYPPASRLFEINVISKDPNEADHLSARLAATLKPHFSQNLLGPESPLISKIKNQYYKRILLKTSRQESAISIRQVVFTAIDQLQEEHRQWQYRVSIDVDPL